MKKPLLILLLLGLAVLAGCNENFELLDSDDLPPPLALDSAS